MISLHLALNDLRDRVSGLLLVAPAVNLLGDKFEAWKRELLDEGQRERLARGEAVVVDTGYGQLPLRQQFLDGYR